MTPPGASQSRSKPTPHPTLSDVALALANRRTDPVSTVSLTRNAAGEVQIVVDVDAASVKDAGRLAEVEFTRLCRKYPRQVRG